MDHTNVPGTEPQSVILKQGIIRTLTSDTQVQAKGDGVINDQNTVVINLKHRRFLCS